jgi:hypothetical protein
MPTHPITIPPRIVQFATLAVLAMSGSWLPWLGDPHVPDYVQTQVRALALGPTEGEGDVYLVDTREWLAEVFAELSPAVGEALAEALPPGEHWLVYVEFQPDGLCYPWVAVIEVEKA